VLVLLRHLQVPETEDARRVHLRFLDLARFLASLEPQAGLLDATEDDPVAYRDERTTYQDRPVSAATWRRRRAAIDGFYDWAVQQDGLLARKPYASRRGGGTCQVK
jgi:site-specific recombinase XerD